MSQLEATVSEDLTNTLQALSLSEPSYLLFNPSGNKACLNDEFSEIPRYLFRITTPRSDGTTDTKWAKSKDASLNRPCRNIDTCSLADDQQAARLLNLHLRWRNKSGDPDNFVSWTSSLLFALQYIIYRHQSPKDGSSLSDINLCVIDTTCFPSKTFLRDMDLIRAYAPFDHESSPGKGLESLEFLRTKQHGQHSGTFYFGEYLSQGALRIEQNCQFASAQEIIDQGLFCLQPEFQKSLSSPSDRPSWSNEVVRLREPFYQPESNAPPMGREKVEAALKIAKLFGPRWRLPVAANLLALLPCQSGDGALLRALASGAFTDEERQQCSPSLTKVMVYDSLPEVQQYDNIMRSLYHYDYLLYLVKMKDGLVEAERKLSTLTVDCGTWNAARNDTARRGSDYKSTMLDKSHEHLLRQANKVAVLSQRLQQRLVAS